MRLYRRHEWWRITIQFTSVNENISDKFTKATKDRLAHEANSDWKYNYSYNYDSKQIPIENTIIRTITIQNKSEFFF